mgnify:CR=1 FL=1
MAKKSVTFSFDDGVTQDIRLIEILNKYGLKGTFNINAGCFSPEDVEKILNSCDRKNAGMTAPAEGLYLNKVTY